LRNKESMYDMKSATEICVGGFGTVYKITNKFGKTVALKKTNMRLNQLYTYAMESYMRETLIFSRLSHPNIIKFIDNFKNKNDALF